MSNARNIDLDVVHDFGEEWARFDQEDRPEADLRDTFDKYFSLLDWAGLPDDAEGVDFGCGTGRWAAFVAERVGRLHCVDPSAQALGVARRKLGHLDHVEFHNASVDQLPFEEGSMDFGYSLGVLHHIPRTDEALASCVTALKPGAPLLLYLYYALDNKPAWFRAVWRASDWVRSRVSRLPTRAKNLVSDAIAGAVYFPLARTAAVLEKAGADVDDVPLSAYRHKTFYAMRTDALDRFGTRLEQRFTQGEIRSMMERSGLDGVRFRTEAPYWCAIRYKTA